MGKWSLRDIVGISAKKIVKYRLKCLSAKGKAADA